MSSKTLETNPSNPDWLLAGFDIQANRYHFARVSRATYQASAFLDHRIQPLPTVTTSLTGMQVDEFLADRLTAPAAWIFHTGFCCSTLLANCLDHSGQTLVLREPLVLSRLAHAKRKSAGGDANLLQLTTKRVIELCERSYQGEALLLKPSNFANSLIGDLFPSGAEIQERKAVLMTSGLPSLLVSILKKRAEAETALPGFLQALLQDSDYLQLTGLDAIDRLDLLQQSVLFWHCQRHFLQQRMVQAGADTFMLLSMERFLSEPLSVLSEVSNFLHLGLSQPTLQQTVESGAFRRHSKQRGQEYDPELHHQEQQATAARFQEEIAAALEWAKPLLEVLPVKAFDQDELNQ